MELWAHQCRSVVKPPQEPFVSTRGSSDDFGPALFQPDAAPAGRNGIAAIFTDTAAFFKDTHHVEHYPLPLEPFDRRQTRHRLGPRRIAGDHNGDAADG